MKNTCYECTKVSDGILLIVKILFGKVCFVTKLYDRDLIINPQYSVHPAICCMTPGPVLKGCCPASCC